MFGYLLQLYQYSWGKDRAFVRKIHAITGIIPRSPAVYHLAFRHSSLIREGQDSARECNERLEYLGDSILGAVVAEYLFKKYPLCDEGFLTEMRSKIVGRQSLNQVGYKMGLDKLLVYNRRGGVFNRAALGNTLEALIGAMFLDRGFIRTKKYILGRFIRQHFDMTELVEQNLNFKSQLQELVQRRKLDMVYVIQDERQAGRVRHFTIACMIGDELYGTGTDQRKKVAEQKASEEALRKLKAL